MFRAIIPVSVLLQCDEGFGCGYLADAAECPLGTFERPDCTLRGVVERTYCCPNTPPPVPPDPCSTDGTRCWYAPTPARQRFNKQGEYAIWLIARHDTILH
eukprot:404260-Pyramimonas_sp.AAC.2